MVQDSFGVEAGGRVTQEESWCGSIDFWQTPIESAFRDFYVVGPGCISVSNRSRPPAIQSGYGIFLAPNILS